MAVPLSMTLILLLVALCAAAPLPAQGAPALPAGPPPAVLLPLDRTAYFIGETVPMALTGAGEVTLEAINADGCTPLYTGTAGAILLDTARLAPGDYALAVNGVPALARFTLTSTLRKSAGSMQDEVLPPDTMTSDETDRIFRESGLTACVALGASDMGRARALDALARSGALLLVNPETRPTSFFPPWNNPAELDGMSQRMILTAQANGRHPNFGGFCYGWDTTGYAVGGRRGLLTYWGWANKTQALRNYIARVDAQKMAEFTRRTGLQPVSEAEYLAYLLSIGRPEFGTAIDLPTKLWLEEIAQYAKPMPAAARVAFETRLDAWSGYLMGLYAEAYGAITQNLRAVDPALRNSSSVQSDHAPVRMGQYFPTAYAPLDFQYQSTWNDQVGGPDFLYQWLLVDALLAMERGGKPTWISNALGAAHHRASFPGKFTRVAAHGLAFGSSGIGFAHEGFSNILGGMNAATGWQKMKGTAGEADLLAGRDFLHRFAALAVEARGKHGVGILWSKTQYGRQHTHMGFGRATFNHLVALTRLGYTPRFVTEEEVATGRAGDVAALVVIAQTFALPERVNAGLAAFVQKGGRILVDGATTVTIPGAERLAFTHSLATPGKPHNWLTPNMVGGDNDVVLYERAHPALATAFTAALGATGRAWLQSAQGGDAKVSLLQIDGGRDAQFIVAVNDSWVNTQADWHQVRETLVPTGAMPATGMIYDCTEEQVVGPAGPMICNLTLTTARVYALLPRALQAIVLSATQSLTAGKELTARVAFLDGAKKPLAAVLPFHLSLLRPDGQVQAEYYRATTSAGAFSMTLPIPANAPAGRWMLAVRSQVTGQMTTLPITITPAKPTAFATPVTERVLVRNRAAIESMLMPGTSLVLPVFRDKHMPAAQRVKATLAARGVTVEIWQQPVLGTYTIAYDPTDSQQQENARIDRGDAIGKITRETVNHNDWASGLSGWRFGKSIVLLDLVGEKGDNPLAETLDGAGMLWPQVSAAFPGAGRAVVQATPWAFGPRTTALVIQAAEVEGLLAGAHALGTLPADRLTPGMTAVKSALWQQYHIGGNPAMASASRLTATGVTTQQAPRPFAIAFPGDQPLPAAQVTHPVATPKTAQPVPGAFTPKGLVPYYRVGNAFQETATVEFLLADLRFSQALMLVADVPAAGPVKITVTGVFRYSDRKPCWQAQWEDVINLREQLVPKERRPLDIEVQIGGKTVGTLRPTKTEQKEVPLELASASAGLKPRTVVEEVVTELSGLITLPAGRQEILFIHRNVVDGKLQQIVVGE
jgi:hypothetical protein